MADRVGLARDLLRSGSRPARRFNCRNVSGPASQLSVSGDRLVALMFGDTQLTVRVYPLPPTRRPPLPAGSAGRVRATAIVRPP